MHKEMTIIVDSREQTPFSFRDEVITETGTLATGDYSIKGLTEYITVERKSLADFVGCCGKGRDRFKKELQRMRSYRARCILIEGSMRKIHGGKWRGKVLSSTVLNSIAGWTSHYDVPIILCDTPEYASDFCHRFLRAFFNRCKSFSKVFN